MLRPRPLPLTRAALAVILALTLAAVGWGHRMPGAADGATAERFLAYQAAGGGTAALCGTTGTPGVQRACDACILISGAGLPPVAATPIPPGGPAAVSPTDAAIQPVPAACHPGWHGRAPPAA